MGVRWGVALRRQMNTLKVALPCQTTIAGRASARPCLSSWILVLSCTQSEPARSRPIGFCGACMGTLVLNLFFCGLPTYAL